MFVSSIGALNVVNQQQWVHQPRREMTIFPLKLALMTTYDILNECMEALEEHEAEHVGADYDETKRCCGPT